MTRLLLLPLVMLLTLAAPAFAQVSIDQPLDERAAARLDRMEKAMKEIRAIVFQGRETGQPVVVQPAQTDAQINGLNDRLNDLDRTLARLNGEIEVIRHDLDQSRQESSDLRAENQSLKQQILALDQEVKALTPPPPPPLASLPPPADPAAAFATAKASYDSGDTAAAEAGFKDYLARFGDQPKAPEAGYYLGRLLLGRTAYADAATADIGAIRGWPQTRWAPEAVLDLARALYGLGKPADACQALSELARRYPTAAPAVKTRAAEVRVQAQCG